MSAIKIIIEFHHGGEFKYMPRLSYEEGDILEKRLDIDYLCVPDFQAMPKELGYDNVIVLFYKFHDEDFEDLEVIQSDKDIFNIQGKAVNGDRLQVFFEHKPDEPLLIPLALPAPPEHDQVDQDEVVGLESDEDDDFNAAATDQVSNEAQVDEQQPTQQDPFEEPYRDEQQQPTNNREDGFHTASWTEIPVDDVIAEADSESDSDFRESDEDSSSEDDLFNPIVDDGFVHEQEEIREWMGKQCKKHVDEFEVDEELLSDYEDSEELRSMSSEGEDDELVRKRRYPDFNEKTDLETADLKVGMKFSTATVFKNALRLYCLREGKDFKYKNNDLNRVAAVCKRNCGWRIWASLTGDGQAFQIKTFYKEHKCGRHTINKKADYKWLGKKYMELFRDTPTFKVAAFVELVRRDHEIFITLAQAYRAKNYAIQANHGSDLEQYTMLWDYCEAIRKWNPGSTVKSQLDGGDFQRLYICFDACRRGFLIGCRPLIGLDACFLKGGFPGQLLCAIGLDANNNMFPIAFAVCENECKATWLWFLEQLLGDIGPIEEHGWTFISDQQKGLMEVLKSRADHRICVRHLYANFNKEFKGKTLNDALWNCARAATLFEFNENMEGLRKLDEDACQWLLKRDPQLWSRHAFSTRVKSDLLLNNISECFNSFILKARDKPIITMMEVIRRLLMKRFRLKLEGMQKLNVQLCPKIQKRLEFSKKYAMNCICHLGRGDRVEVEHCFHGLHVVDLKERTCTCRRWDLNGIPCGHACAAIFFNHEAPENYVHQWYSRETFLQTYEPMLHPMPGPQDWPKTSYNPINPPPFKKQPGRPKKMRRRGADEVGNPNKISRVGTLIRCGRCNELGHNARRCNGVPDPARSAYHAMKAQQSKERRAMKKAEKEAEISAAAANTKKKGKKKGKKQTGASQPSASQPICSHGETISTQTVRRAMGGSQPNPSVPSGSQGVFGSKGHQGNPTNVVLPSFGQGNAVFSNKGKC